ncbi:glycosyltransferase family 2 protein [Sulfuricystis multivorans]|uniref:glycosyltransferase family 2 protein n=1 Tax=Sulfuricystis multivorans TaxID=2211108 RepID=UPI0024E02D4D|nr:glycosyltransferase family A protein [Sulfuricystis multivorans]
MRFGQFATTWQRGWKGSAVISVVIPLYNKERHIAKAIESVLGQATPPAEVIVVDDGSTDGGAEIVKSYSEPVRLIKQANRGVSAARNRGIREARHEHVAFLDADDWWEAGHLETLERLIQRFPEAGLYSTAHRIFRAGQYYRPRSVFRGGWVGVVDNFFEAYGNGLSLVNSITACVKRSCAMEMGGFPVGIKRGEDIILWCKLALRYPVAHSEIPTAVYNQQAMNRSDQLREMEPPGSLVFLAELLGSSDLDAQTRRGVAMLFDRIAFFTAAGFALNQDYIGIDAIRRIARTAARHRVAGALTLLRLVPTSLLRLARHFRHRREDYPCAA